jgi:hypothetical protein
MESTNKNIFLVYTSDDNSVNTINDLTSTDIEEPSFKVYSMSDITFADTIETEITGIKFELPSIHSMSRLYENNDQIDQNTDPYKIVLDIVTVMIDENNKLNNQ